MLGSEAYLYALEGTTMLLIVFVFLVLHPDRLRMEARKHSHKWAEDGMAAAM